MDHLDYKTIKSQRGKPLIVYENYTFSKTSNKNNSWACSTKAGVCKARIKLDPDGKIIRVNNEHTHPPNWKRWMIFQ